VKQLLYILLLLSSTSFGQVTLTESFLPIIEITTLPGEDILDDPRITCEMGIIDNGQGQTNFVGDPYSYLGFIEIEIRGSTSQQYPKKNYGFSTVNPSGLDIDISLLDMPPENDWILYGPYPDKTLLRNVLTFELYRRMGHYASRTEYCELTIDGDYKGLYVLMEKIKRDDARVAVTKLDSTSTTGIQLTGGYVFKVDKTTGTVVETFVSAYNPEVLFQYHDPGPDELDPLQKSYLQSYVSNFEDVLWGSNYNDTAIGYPKLIERISFFDFFIMQELGRTVDGYRSSSFLYKDRDDIWGGRLQAGPIWDFNLSYGNADYCDANLTTGWQYEFDLICPWFSTSIPFWWGKLLNDTTYANDLQCRWQNLRQGPLHIDSLNNWIDSVALYLEDARIRNFQEWPIIGVYVNWNGFVGTTYQEDVDYLKTYLENRMLWMDANLPGTCWPGTANLEEIHSDKILSRVWPNPIPDLTYIGFTLNKSGNTLIEITDMNGRLIKHLALGNLSIGNYIKEWESSEIQRGVYLISIMQAGNLIGQHKVVKQ
jgi:CotH kinase protein/Secretion system C-terminal sorting domain